MTDDDRRRELQGDLKAAFNRAYSTLESDQAASALLELYQHGFITAMEVMNFVWRAFHDNDDARDAVCAQLRAHSDASIREIPVLFDEPGFDASRVD